MSPRSLRILFLLLLLGAAASLPLWWDQTGAGRKAGAEDAGQGSPTASETSEEKTAIAAATPDLAREALAHGAEMGQGQSEEVPLRPSPDGQSRIHVQLEGFEKVEHEWLQALSRNLEDDLVVRGRIKGPRLSLEVDPGTHRLSVKIGGAVRMFPEQPAGVRRLGTSEQDFREREILVPDGQEATVTYRPHAAGVVFGQVKRGSLPAADVKVQLVGDPSVLVQTDADGGYRFENVPTGRRTVRLGRPYLGVWENLTVEEGEEHRADLNLAQDSSFLSFLSPPLFPSAGAPHPPEPRSAA